MTEEPTTPSAAAARTLLDRRTPPEVIIRRRIIAPGHDTGVVLERRGPLGNVGPYKRVEGANDEQS